MTHMAQQASVLVRQKEGSTTGVDKPAMWTQRSFSAKSLENFQEGAALEITMQYLNSHMKLVSRIEC